MPTSFVRSLQKSLFAIGLTLLSVAVPRSVCAQLPAGLAEPESNVPFSTTSLKLDVVVRDQHGGSLDAPASVRLSNPTLNYHKVSVTQANTRFDGLEAGEYVIEITCPGFRKTVEHVKMEWERAHVPMYLYLVPELEPNAPSAAANVKPLPWTLRPDMEKGIDAIEKEHYADARKILTRLLPKSHDHPDVLCYLGVAELGAKHTDVAQGYLQRALAADPGNQLALFSMGHLRLTTSPADAIPILQQALSSGHANWRASYDLATAYLKVKRLGEAESQALRAVQLAKPQNGGAAPTYLLARIRYEQGKHQEAKQTWESILKDFPSDPMAARAKRTLAHLETSPNNDDVTADEDLPADSKLVSKEERLWAPPDVDSASFELAPGVTCQTETVLDAAFNHMKSQLMDFEKFSATEHIERQDIDRFGYPGATKTLDSSYIVSVYPLGKNSFYVEEFRNGPESFPVLTTTHLNTMGVNILQPYYRGLFNYSCEGLVHVRDQAAWQIYFAQKPDAKESIRIWQLKDKKTYQIPIKGRVWISSGDLSLLRVETDLREPVKELQLTKDHFIVDYGPVNFAAHKTQLWLPWSAEMYVEFQGKRYHHRHYLSDYLFFAVDATDKVGKPKESQQP